MDGVISDTGNITLQAGGNPPVPGKTGDILKLDGLVKATLGNITLSAGNEIIENVSPEAPSGTITRNPNLNAEAPPPTPTCPTGQELVGGMCQPITCPTGYHLVGSTCQAITCPTGQQLVGNTCQAIICPTGQELVGNLCQPIACPGGKVFIGTSCPMPGRHHRLCGRLQDTQHRAGNRQLYGHLLPHYGGTDGTASGSGEINYQYGGSVPFQDLGFTGWRRWR